jgi:hypothetical protein
MRPAPDKANAHTTQAFTNNYAKDANQPSSGASSGRLTDWPARAIFEYLYREKFSGHLSISFREKKKKLWFYKGEVIRIQSNLIPELLGHLMIERGWINEPDLQTCLKLQREAAKEKRSARRLGDLVREIYGISSKEMEELFVHQKIASLLQAMTWEEGEYEFSNLEIKNPQSPLISYRDLVQSIHHLFDVSPSPLGPLFKIIKPWQPRSATVDLSETPLWAVLAGCRMASANGILSVRKQNKLFEIVIKFGVPLTLYEGTFGQPRQTVVVRQASEEHEKFFVDQVFKLFSFLTGSAHFRLLSEVRPRSGDSESYLQIREETNVTRSLSPDEMPFELQSHFLIEKQTMLHKLKTKLSDLLFSLASLNR